MKESKHIIFRKLIAGGLLALLVFVYAEKFSHTHHTTSVATEQAGYSASISFASCAICDFTLAKDAALPEPDCIAVPVTVVPPPYIAAASTYYFLPENSISNKGPPAC